MQNTRPLRETQPNCPQCQAPRETSVGASPKELP
uniref:Uncharacterized protein n=1 Tax=Anguilla anguilla TaxID=7936 RepID=A0A0E9Q0G9_ANGAN